MPLDLEAEEWRDIPNFKGYQVSNFGRVRSFWRRTSNGAAGSTFDKWRWAITDQSKILPLFADKGYWKARLSRENKQYRIFVHLLVLIAFVGPRPEGLQGRHLNDDKDNNHLSNLAWGTKSKNIQERHTNRTTPVFALTPKDVMEIRSYLAQGEKNVSIARKFNVDPTLISRIKTGQRWAFV